MSVARTLFLLCFFALLGACEGTVESPCLGEGQNQVICGLQAPEDIEILPDHTQLILSHFGGLFGESSGSLSVFNTRDNSRRILFPSNTAPTDSETELWGDTDCKQAPGSEFSPHGIHLSQRSDGRWQLLVVNHGGRESVEFFEWLEADQTLQWRGCAIMPEDSYLNDVVASPEGGLIVSHMFKKHDNIAAVRSLFGAKLGHLWYWRRDQMVSVLPGSRGSFPNGVQLSPDGKAIFVNLYGESSVVKLDRRSGAVLGKAVVQHPDNSYWMPDGRLLVASQPMDSFIPTLCTKVESGYCPAPFALVAVNPDSMETETLFQHKGSPMGAGTVAVEVNGKWYIGSYAGNRLLIVPAIY
jgi:hypothetical protein